MFLASYKLFLCLSFVMFITCGFQCTAQDPWDYEEKSLVNDNDEDKNIPPDLRIVPKKEPPKTSDSFGIGEWFYRRILSIILKGGLVKENEDGSVDISLQMKLDKKQWNTLDEYLASKISLTEEKFRRSLGYIEQSIYVPSLPTKIILSTGELIKIYLAAYKTEITWTFALVATFVLLFWIWRHMSHKNVVVIIAIALYAYEVFVSYKEAEQKEIEKFLTAVNSCKWYFWSSECDMPKPNILIFLKHMNPLKIGVRMCSTIISEPILVLSDTVKTLTHGITDGLWYPLNIIMNGIIYTVFIVILLIVFITILCNYVLNIPINLSFWLFSVGLRQRNRTVFSVDNHLNHCNSVSRAENMNTISTATLDKLIDVFSRAINTPNRNNNQGAIQNVDRSPKKQITNSNTAIGLKRSASTGRLPNTKSFDNVTNLIKKDIDSRFRGDGDGATTKRYKNKISYKKQQ